MKLLIASGVTNAVGKSHNVSWTAFQELMKKYSIAHDDESEEEKRRVPWFSCCEYTGNHRRRENIIGRPWAIVADLDQVYDPEAVRKGLAKWEYLAWTTWRSTAQTPRWRVVLPVEAGIDPDSFGALVDRILAPIAEAAKIDPRTRFVEQLWFTPGFKASRAREHKIWHHAGRWIGSGTKIAVDFTGVRLSSKPEEIEEGGRNEALVMRLNEADALRCESQDELFEVAMAWNSRLKTPMARREVSDVTRKKWHWLQRGEGLLRRADAWRGRVPVGTLPDIGVGLLSNTIRTAKLPPSIVGDFMYPGATMISAKMKEGKSFLAMQLAMSIATAVPFLGGARHPGFIVKAKKKTIVIAGEDTAGGIAERFLGSIAAGHLPDLDKSTDVKVVFNDDLDQVRKARPKIPGLALFESLVNRWYEQGYRIIAIDPLRVLEAALHIDDYPGTSRTTNIHARDFQTMRYFTKLAQQYDDLCILISMHHGKNKRDHDATDPGDMIAGTTGFGAGAITTISLLPIAEQLEAEEDHRSGRTPKRRELYLHGRYTREQRYLVEQDPNTGVWSVLGDIVDELMSLDRQKYFDALIQAGGTTGYISAEDIAKAAGGRTKPGTVHKVLNRARSQGNTHLGWKLVVKRGSGGGYHLIGGTSHSVRRKNHDE